MQFLLEQERAYIGANNLLEKLARLDVDPLLYELRLPFIFKPEELHYYVESILNDMRGKKLDDENYQYVCRICDSLLSWAEKGFIVHVM